MYYRITCDFIIKADTEAEVTEFLASDDIPENHLMIEPCDKPANELDIYADIPSRKGGE